MDYQVFFYEAFEEEENLLRQYLPQHIKAGFTWKTIQETGHEDLQADIISTRTQSIYPEHWAENLKAIISRSTGYEHLTSYKEQTQADISLGYLPKYCSRAVAEHAMLSWTALLRRLPRQIRQFSKFNRDGISGYELQNKTIVVYGVGNIGYEVVKISRALDMQVLGVDIEQKFGDVEYVTAQDGAKRADIIVCAMNLTNQNAHYFNATFFKDVKAHLVFVNVSRGEISPTTEILAALENRVIGAAALDVFDHEKNLSVGLRSGLITSDPQVQATQKMLQMDNVILTPHNAFNTHEAIERKSHQTIEQIEFFLKNGKFIWQA